MAMKLYYWPNVRHLADYGDGMCFAMAESKKQAVACIVGTYAANRKHVKSVMADVEALEAELKSTKPIVRRKAAGFWEYGSASHHFQRSL